MLDFLKKKPISSSPPNKGLGQRILNLFIGKQTFSDELSNDLETLLISAGISLNTTDKLLANLKQKAPKKMADIEALKQLLKTELSALLPPDTIFNVKRVKPFVILVVGVNGAGKTTTIGKMAHFFKQHNKSVMLAAGDTFRAAAVEQLKVWGERNDIAVVAQSTGADSASVIYDALQSAQAKKVDILIADTAGRLHTQNNLMNELAKITRVLKKQNIDTPHETMLVVDAASGQNAIAQVKTFNEHTPLSGISITKLDGTAKGGIIFSIAEQFQIPIRFIGTGEQITDLKLFNKDNFIDTIFA